MIIIFLFAILDLPNIVGSERGMEGRGTLFATCRLRNRGGRGAGIDSIIKTTPSPEELKYRHFPETMGESIERERTVEEIEGKQTTAINMKLYESNDIFVCSSNL